MTVIQTQTTLQFANSYIDKGLPVFPIRPDLKKPATTNGFKDATLDQEVVEGWFTNTSFNIGIATGLAGLVVIDIDLKADKDGAKNFEDWLAGRELPLTLTVRTRSGGLHYFFRGTGIKSAQDKQGGYVVAPPSFVEADKKGPAGYYEFINDLEIADLPEWLARRFAPINTILLPARRYFSRKLKWGPIRFQQRKMTWGVCLRRPAFVPLQPKTQNIGFRLASYFDLARMT